MTPARRRAPACESIGANTSWPYYQHTDSVTHSMCGSSMDPSTSALVGPPAVLVHGHDPQALGDRDPKHRRTTMNPSETTPQRPDESTGPTDGATTEPQDGLVGTDAHERFNDAVERRMTAEQGSAASSGTTAAPEEEEDSPVRPQNS